MFELITYLVFSLTFSSSCKLSGPTDAGMNAKMFIYEAEGKENLSLTFVLFSQESQKQMPLNETELMNYFKSTFMGTSKPAVSKKNRTILGKQSEGEILVTKIPVVSDLEVHIVSLKNGDKVGIGFKAIKEMPEDKREALISEILGSIKN